MTRIVYFSTAVHLTGDTSGCGILLVEGDLNVDSGFNWYGPILATGSVNFSGGGSGDKLITGAILSGSSINADLVGGNTSIAYCSTAISKQTQSLPLLRLGWKELL